MRSQTAKPRSAPLVSTDAASAPRDTYDCSINDRELTNAAGKPSIAVNRCHELTFLATLRHVVSAQCPPFSCWMVNRHRNVRR